MTWRSTGELKAMTPTLRLSSSSELSTKAGLCLDSLKRPLPRYQAPLLHHFAPEKRVWSYIIHSYCCSHNSQKLSFAQYEGIYSYKCSLHLPRISCSTDPMQHCHSSLITLRLPFHETPQALLYHPNPFSYPKIHF